jgi:hypothetical protein
MYPYRVFLSYAHADRSKVEKVSVVLGRLGLIPVWDPNIRPGSRFTDQIKEEIETAHVFMPLLTQNSLTRPWVHQETGYALGRGVPVLPLAIGGLPGEMIAELQAVRVARDLSDLAKSLSQIDLDVIVMPPSSRPPRRTRSLKPRRNGRVLSSSMRIGCSAAPVRAGAAAALISSFAMPSALEADADWGRHDGPHRQPASLRRLLREERTVLERHARVAGCSLLLAPEWDPGPDWRDVHRFQIAQLLAFLSSMFANLVQVAFSRRTEEGNVTIVGDWFVAHAVAPSPGAQYRKSVFSSHAPEVLRWLRAFDQELSEARGSGAEADTGGLDTAIARLRRRLESLAKP